MSEEFPPSNAVDSPRVALARELVSSVFADAVPGESADIDRAAVEVVRTRLNELLAEADDSERGQILAYGESLEMLRDKLDRDG